MGVIVHCLNLLSVIRCLYGTSIYYCGVSSEHIKYDLLKLEDVSECLTVIIPCFNEENTVAKVITKVNSNPYVGEIIAIDDSSTDCTLMKIIELKYEKLKILKNDKNMGKGFSVSRGIEAATMPFVIIQDADLEYNPDEYGILLRPLLENNAAVVFGSRFLGAHARRVLYFRHKLANIFLTFISNLLSDIDLTDMETCYKLMRIEVAKSLKLNEKRFGVEPEITAKVAALRVPIFEVPISYFGRTYEEGKKINWKDGVSALWCIIKYSRPSVRRKVRLRYETAGKCIS